MIDKQIAEQLYDPHKGSWLDFVKAHKSMRTAKGLLDLKAISKLWKAKGRGKTYDPKSRQSAWEKHLRAKAHEGKKLKGQQRLTSAVSTSKRLPEFTYDPQKIDNELLSKVVRKYGLTKNPFESGYLLPDGSLLNYGLWERGEAHEDIAIDKNLTVFEHQFKTGIIRIRIMENETNVSFIKGQPVTEEQFNKLQVIRQGKIYYDVLTVRGMPIRGGSGTVFTVEGLKEELFHKNMALQNERARRYDPAPLTSAPTRWSEAMVKGIKHSSDVRNPYAIVKSIWSKLTPSKRAEIKRRAASGQPIRYDLPLPDDKPTKGTGTVRMVKPFKLTEVQVNLSVKDYFSALKSGLFSKMRRQDGSIALVARCKSPVKNCNIFIDKVK